MEYHNPTPIVVTEHKQPVESQNEPITGIEKLIRDTFPEEPDLMVAISKCESNMSQFDSGGNVITRHTQDVGVMQIHYPLWEEKAIKLGYDIYTTRGNILMARYIYDVQNVEAWMCYPIVTQS